ncbi:MAG TPA: glycosyltransferase [Candidatus Acidoferrum sp.]|jgi:glycosyltransferase involved in cell wall biosynthesis|nr:glycosyltransferase [Candidatus Acidoferrum sp.]
MARYPHIPQHVVIFSFEGPDRYAMVGGLGVRVSELAVALDNAGKRTDLIFVGDPHLEPVESRGATLTLRRWCQWISLHHPLGVYDGEWGKMEDYRHSVPSFVLDEILRPAVARGERVLVMAEDWHVAPAVLTLDRIAREAGLRDALTILWNANNTYGFHTIDFHSLAAAATITCVSRYMKFELAQHDAPALVIPNGIPERVFTEASAAGAAYLRRMLANRHLLLKVGRFDPDKRWLQAVDAVADLRAQGVPVQLIARGGKEPYAGEVFARATQRGLVVDDVHLEAPTAESLAGVLANSHGDIVNIRSFLPDELLYTLYAAVDAVLANSGKEPFGLVGLEVMASGGIAVCGSTGEDYARAFDNAIVCDTADPLELASYLERFWSDPGARERMIESAHATAREFIWPSVLDILDAKLAFATARS